MQPTRIRLLLAIAFIAGVVGWVVATLTDSLMGRYLPLPWTAAVAVWFLVVALAMWGWIVRPRLLHRPGSLPLPPYVAARTAALALAASRVGAGVLGFYAGAGLALVGSLEIPAARDGAITAALTALGGLAMAVTALWLEHMCRIKDDDDEHGGAQKPDAAIGGVAGGATERTANRPRQETGH